MNNKTWQKVLAVPATLSIGLGGALLAVAPAHAVATDDATSAVSAAPTDEPTSTPTPSVTPEPTVDPTASPAPSDAPTSTPAPSQTPAPTETPAPGDPAEEPVFVVLPTPVLSTPTAGQTLAGPEFAVSGTGTPGNYVLPLALEPDVYDEITGGTTPPPAARAAAPSPVDPSLGGFLVAADGTWNGTVAVDAAGEYTVGAAEYTVDAEGNLTGASAFTPGVDVTVTITPLVAAPPVITAPTAGEVVRAQNITISGTGTPGANVAVFVATPSYYDEYVAAQLELLNSANGADEGEFRAQALAAEPEPSNPEDPIVVDANGNWSVVLPLEIGAYRAGAVQAVTANGQYDLSDVSATVDFSVAAVLPAPVALPGTTPAGGTLPETGSDAGLIAGLGGLLVLAGGAALLARRRLAERA